MADSATIAKLRLVYPDFAVRLRRVHADMLQHHRAVMKVTEGLRSLATQAEYWARGRAQLPSGKWEIVDSKAIITKAAPGDSIHHYGLAGDSCFVSVDDKKCHPYLEGDARFNALWAAYGKFAQGHGLVWGFDWNGNGKVDKNDYDRPHVELTYGLDLATIKALYKVNGLTGVWAKIDQIRQVRVGGEWYGPQASARRLDLSRTLV